MEKKDTNKHSLTNIAKLKEELLVSPGEPLELDKHDPDSKPCGLEKKEARQALDSMHERLNELQEMLYAEAGRAVLIVLQAMDTGGKDGTIRKVFGPLNPQGVQVASFKQPTPEELAHDFLWRIHREIPRKGMIRIFNRSHYEDVLIARVHKLVDKNEIQRRYEQINAFEKHLADNGVTILKFYLHISKDEQKQRLQDRLDRPDKHWKFSSGDLAERKLWDEYMAAYAKALQHCSTPWAPWYVIPANRKWSRDYAIGKILLDTLEAMGLNYPQPEEGLDKITIQP
ncbi:MAG: polyphosphate kinase 2 family protein [Verrucomicrobiota bacterium]